MPLKLVIKPQNPKTPKPHKRIRAKIRFGIYGLKNLRKVYHLHFIKKILRIQKQKQMKALACIKRG